MTRRRVEKVLGALEGGYAVTYASGLAAVSAAMFLLKPQLIYVEQKSGYFGCHDVMHMHQSYVNSYVSGNNSSPLGIQLVPLEQLDKDIGKQNLETLRRIVWLETPKNPTCEQEDVQLYASKAAKIGAQVVVDGTFGTPVLQQPLKLGATLVLHSTTKYLSGHSDALGGCLCTKSEDMYRQLKRERSVIGNTMGVLESYLLLRSLRTLSVRVQRQSQSAQEVAQWLASQIGNPETCAKVTKVHYPTLKTLHPVDWDICQRQMGGKGPGILSFELDSQANVEPFLKKLKLVIYATSLGGHEVLLMTHAAVAAHTHSYTHTFT